MGPPGRSQPFLTLGLDSELTAVDQLATDDAWAAGWYEDRTGTHPLFEHWDGLSWSLERGGQSTSGQSDWMYGPSRRTTCGRSAGEAMGSR
jgi:hypothetical protein